MLKNLIATTLRETLLNLAALIPAAPYTSAPPAPDRDQAMSAQHPRSLMFLLLLGCGCLTLPLGLGLHRAGDLVGGIGQEAMRLLHEGVETARRTREVVGIAGDLDRNARQIQVLKDPALAAIYHERHLKLLHELQAIEATSPSEQTLAASVELRRLAIELDRVIVDPSIAALPLAEYLPRSQKLLTQSRKLELLGRQRFDDALLALGETTEAARRTLGVQGLALIPITLVMAVVFSALVMRPIRALARAIRSLGEGGLSGRIRIPGPSEIASLGDELAWLRARLAAAEEEKNGFLIRMSHDLKTPLASLREGTELLADGSVGPLAAKQREVVDIMRESAGGLDLQIHNLLAVTASNASAAEPRNERLRVDNLLTQVLRSHQLEIAAKRIQVDTRFEDISVDFDPQHLRMAVDNVMGNAVKFTPNEGTIRVELRLQRGRVLIDVIDSGPGIAKEDRDLVFRPFFQGEAATNTPLRGAGVGLSVVRDCLRTHGGEIRILDSATRGAHIRMTLHEAQHAH